MKIIVVSIVAWDRNNNFGKTFCDIFEGMEDIEFLNIYCSNGMPNNNVQATYFQITLKDIIKNIFNSKHKVGNRIEKKETARMLSAKQKNILNKIKARRWRIFLWARRFFWWIGKWKTNELEQIIKEFDADLVFLPIFKESYMNIIQQYVIEKSGKRAIAYYGDDNYSLRMFSMNPFFWFDRLSQRGLVKKTIEKCEYMYVVSEIEKQECERDFQKKCYICTKGADFSAKPELKEKYNIKKEMVYTGNLGNYRWEELYYIGKALDKINEGHKLVIYSGTPLTKHIKEKFDRVQSIVFKGRVPVEDIPRIQKEADILVHVESFRLRERLLVHQSFSTKLVDHFVRARCTFAVGAPDIAFVDYLLKKDAAVVATSRNEMEKKLRKLLNSDEMINEYAIKGYECGKENHDINQIQNMLRSHFRNMIGVKR